MFQSHSQARLTHIVYTRHFFYASLHAEPDYRHPANLYFMKKPPGPKNTGGQTGKYDIVKNKPGGLGVKTS